MSSQNLGEVSKNLYDLLASLEKEDRKKVLTSVLALFGEDIEQAPVKNRITPTSHAGNDEKEINEGVGSAKDFFSRKSPENRGEMLAVAARYLELTEEKEVVTKEDIANVFKEARRNFDSKNFARDMRNAVHNAKFFLSGGERETYKLSFFGQEYVDALPEKEQARTIKRPGKVKKKSVKKDEE